MLPMSHIYGSFSYIILSSPYDYTPWYSVNKLDLRTTGFRIQFHSGVVFFNEYYEETSPKFDRKLENYSRKAMH